MNYTPIWNKIVDSSLWDEPDYVVKIFLTMLAKKEKDYVVRGSAYNISRWAKKTEAEVLEALKILSNPDTKRLEPQPYEGRRIERVEDAFGGGWLILNAEYYRKMASKENFNNYQAGKQREYRADRKVEAGVVAPPKPKRRKITARQARQRAGEKEYVRSQEQDENPKESEDCDPYQNGEAAGLG